MKISFIGTGACIPSKGGEVASFMINDNVLIDTGWCNVLRMLEHGLHPEKIEYLILTHLHQDHYIGLPQLLFYLGITKLNGAYSQGTPLKIIGPSEKLNSILKLTKEFLQLDRYAELVIQTEPHVLIPGKSYEDEKIRLDTMLANHRSGVGVEEAMVCRFMDKGSGKTVCFTGDTSYHPPIANFAKGLPVLIHDSCHSSASEAATIAKEAGVGRLFLIHHPASENEAKLREAKEIFSKSFLADACKEVEV